MKRRQRYIVITVAVVTVLVVSITLGVVLGGPENSKSESRLAASDTGEPTFSPFITPNATLNTVPPSLKPTVRPEENFTEFPSLDPTVETNYSETLQPSNFSFSPAPSYNSTEWPTLSPSVDLNSTMLPSVSTAPSYWNENAPNKTSSVPSLQPSLMPTFLKPPKSKTPEPSSYPSLSPTRLADGDGKIASIAPTGHDSEKLHDPASGTRFYAIGDVPYTSKEARELKVQIDNLPQDAEFVIHVGDIRSAKNGKKCEIQEYHEVAAILNQSHAPVFLVLGGTYP